MKDQDKPKKTRGHEADQGDRVAEMGQQIADLQRQVKQLEEARAQRVRAERVGPSSNSFISGMSGVRELTTRV